MIFNADILGRVVAFDTIVTLANPFGKQIAKVFGGEKIIIN